MQWHPNITSVRSLRISGYVPHTEVTEGGILFTAVVPEGEKADLLLYEKGSDKVQCEIPFPEAPVQGSVYAMLVSGIRAKDIEYNYRIGGKIVTDPAAQTVSGLEKYADRSARSGHRVRGGFADPDFDWGEDNRPLCIPYSESVFYELHVRGFTKSPTSKVKHRGTFCGVTQKIPHLKALGVTAVVLMPCYEFDEVLPDRLPSGWRPEGLLEEVPGDALQETAPAYLPDETGMLAQKQDVPDSGKQAKVNFWGFGPGWYFAPKSAYCAGDDPVREFRSMVKAMHEAGIEVIMEMNFPQSQDPAFMQACLFWWRECYHVDGFLLIAAQDDVNALAKSPALSDVKLISDYFDTKRVYPEGRAYRFRNLAEYNVGFRNDARRFLKGDADSLQAFVSRCRYNPADAGVINAVTGHDGFTLYDLVSYNDKHNEANVENNRDGAPTEFSWNCGTEGPSRRREISRLRMRQMKNALAMLMLSQGTPMITAGDEMLNSQTGNSNPYCYDSELTWVRWSRAKEAQELCAFLQELSAFRKAHPLLHQTAELTGASAGGFFPDFSCHGTNAWFASFDRQDRSIGMMYCAQAPDEGAAHGDGGSGGPFLYAAYNLHWEEKELALPILPAGREWHTVIDTASGAPEETLGGKASGSSGAKEKSVRLPGRSIRVLVG